MTAHDIPELSDRQKVNFWRKVKVLPGPDGCHIWTGAKRRGYGIVVIRGRKLAAHRVSFIISGGTFENGPIVLHGPCNNKACVNPAHLSSGTYQQNQDDRLRDGTRVLRVKPPPQGRPKGDSHYARRNPEKMARGERHGNAKLTVERVIEIRSLAAIGDTYAKLSRNFGVSVDQIGNIVRREVWKHV